MTTLALPDGSDRLVALDTEGSGLYPDDGARVSIVALAWDGGSIVLPFDQGYETWLGPKHYPRKYPGPSLSDTFENYGLAEWEQLIEWLQRQSLVFHNAKYDMHMMSAGLRNRPETGIDLAPYYVWDTMVVAPLLWPNEKVSLDYLGATVLGQGKLHSEALNAWKRRYLDSDSRGRYDLIPTDLIVPYADQDPRLTFELFLAENRLIHEGHATWEAVDRELDEVVVLYHMEETGVGFDVAGCLREDATMGLRQERLEDELRTLTGMVHPTEDAMRRYWFDQLLVKPVKTTDGDKPSVAADVVRVLVERGVPGADQWQQLAKIRSARSKWYQAWPALTGPDGRLRTSYRQTKSAADMHDDSGPMKGTISARLAVERWQAQAIPHNYQIPDGIVPVRKLFEARPGCILVEIDVSQAEMRAVAGLSKCTPLLERFARGEDAHSALCQTVFRIEKDDERWDFHRNLSKRLGFGIVYGAGIPTLIEQIRLWTGYEAEEDEVQEWWNAAKESMPQVFRYSRALRRQAEETRMIELVGGRVRHFASHEFTHKAMNAKIQGSVAVAMVDSMIGIHQEFGPGRLLLQIHDSVLLELPRRWADKMTATAQDIICQTFEGHFGAPFVSDSKVWG